MREIRDQLEAIWLAVTKPPRVRTPKAKAPPKTAYGWFKCNWSNGGEFRAMLLERMPSIDDTLEVYKGLGKDKKALVRELFEA